MLIQAFPKDINIMLKTSVDVNGEFVKLEEAVKHFVMKINEKRAKYMTSTRTEHRNRIERNIIVDQNTFERVDHIKQLRIQSPFTLIYHS